MKLTRLFTEHPETVGESYFQHLCVAAWFGGQLLLASLACFVHALFPFLFTKTGSGIIQKLHTRMVTARSAKSSDESRELHARG